MSETVSNATLVSWLNEYFDKIAVSIMANGGEILKFIGDAVLAIFPMRTSQNEKTICQNAFKAALKADEELILLNNDRKKRNDQELKHGIALHRGLVEYGNIGAAKRLDFTVIGQAVNLASRIETICAKTSRSILASEAFVRQLNDADFISIGDFHLKGLRQMQRLFAPKENKVGLDL